MELLVHLLLGRSRDVQYSGFLADDHIGVEGASYLAARAFDDDVAAVDVSSHPCWQGNWHFSNTRHGDLLPHEGEDFAPNPLTPRVAPGHDTLGGRHNG